MARDRYVRAWFCDWAFDQALWCADHHGRWGVAQYCMHWHCFVWGGYSPVLDSLILFGRRLEFLVYWKHYAVYAGLYATRERQSPSSD